jgi:CHAT domain-containing protein
LLIRQQKFSEAQELASNAAEVFEKQQVPVRAANARVLSAQTWHELAHPEFALEQAERALEELQGYHAPWVSYQCHNTLGRLKELDGSIADAEKLYLKAIEELESLRGNIRLDELQMSFGKDKYQVYENMVNLQLNKEDFQSAFSFVERSKSRTLIDLLERNLESVWDPGADESPRLQRVRKIREELNILYSRLNEVGASAAAGAQDDSTKEEIGQREHELVELLRGVGSEKSGWAKLQSMKVSSAKDVQSMLGPDEALIEYYMIGDRYQAFVVTNTDFHVVRDIATTAEVRQSLKGLSFQMTKFHLNSRYLERHGPQLLEATLYHLRRLHALLMDKLESLVPDRTLVVIPHHALHYVPFHALNNGENYLIDRHDIVYGASASVIRICREKSVVKRSEDLVLAVADDLTPFINEEVNALQSLLPNARVFTGKDAREDKLKQYGPKAGKIHIAAHGIFRSDNPMFSSLRLGESWLNLFDIFNLQLGAELTTLSACETGMSAVWEGDELLGLARGFLYAGTPSLVVSLWTVNDRSTAQLMQRFYTGLNAGTSKSRALREAMVEVKKHFPHPFYWAPFVLMGKN